MKIPPYIRYENADNLAMLIMNMWKTSVEEKRMKTANKTIYKLLCVCILIS